MTLPTTSDVHVNRPLTNMCVAFMQALTKFQADDMAPIMPVDKKSDIYFRLLKSYWFSDKMRKRGVGAPAIRAGYGVGQSTYLCDLWSLGKPIDDQVRANEDTPLNSDRTAMKFVTRQERMNREQGFKSEFWGTGKWTTDITGNTSTSAVEASKTLKQWNQSTSTPIDDVAAMMVIMEKLTGFTPNEMAISAEVWKVLKTNAQILDRISGGSTNAAPAKVTRELVAGLFEIDVLRVLNAVENTGGDADADFDGDYIFGKQGLLYYKDASMDLETATAMRTFCWRQYAGTQNGVRMLKWRDESTHSDVVEIESTYDHVMIAPDMGIYLDQLVA